MFQVPAETLLRGGRQGSEGLVAFQRLLLRFDWKWSHAAEDSLPHVFGPAAAGLLKKLGAALGRLSIEVGQPLAEMFLRHWRHSLEERVLLQSSRLLFRR